MEHPHTPLTRLGALGLAALLLSSVPSTLSAAPTAGEERTFVVTAYYSPVPGQCCYVQGSELADKVLNGEGIKGADGTPVYPGMVAAPSVYPFGTGIELDGIGTVTVHDRGGAIKVLDGDVHRIDLWVGYGEEGLARAMTFGVRRVTGRVLPAAPAAGPTVDFQNLEADLATIAPYDVRHGGIFGARAQAGDTNITVKRLQVLLQNQGYFDHEITGKFGEVTAQSLQAFVTAMGLDEPSDRLTDRTAAVLEEAERRADLSLPFKTVDADSSADTLLAAKRVLRFLGVFAGRTTPTYDDQLKSAILGYQQAHALVGDATSAGAGRIGPKTLALLEAQWKRTLAVEAAERRLVSLRVRAELTDDGRLLSSLLGEGSEGAQVRLLQEVLVGQGLLPADKVTGTFGEQTKTAVAAFQIREKIVAASDADSAGWVGPETLRAIRTLQLQAAVAAVRGQGWAAL